MLDSSVQALFQMAAQYVCLAFALEPFKEVYQRSLSVVRSQLPLPFLRSGYLMLVRPDSIGTIQVTCHAWTLPWHTARCSRPLSPTHGRRHLAQETWVRNWFVLNESSLTEVEALKIEEHQALRKEALLASLKPTRPDAEGSRAADKVEASGRRQPSAQGTEGRKTIRSACQATLALIP